MTSAIYAYNNTATVAGSYELFPVLWVLGVASAGGGSVTFENPDTTGATTLDYTLTFAPALIGAVNPYTVVADSNTNVTIEDTSGTLIGLLTGSTITANGGSVSIADTTAISALTGTTFNIENGGKIYLTYTDNSSVVSALSGSNVTFGTGGGTLVLSPGSNLSILTFESISGFSEDGAIIEIVGATSVQSVVTNGTTTTITTNTGVSVTVEGTFDAADKNLYEADVDGNLYISATAAHGTTTGTLVCFLEGTEIATQNGPISVEKLTKGDDVIVYDWQNDVELSRQIIWVGKARCVVNPNLPKDVAGYPVRVGKNSISDNVPHMDLLVTPEHCLFFEGKFIPVRMLVNGESIYYDTSFTSYEYYHIETEDHSIISANGVLTESYLDTGNRRSFNNERVVSLLQPVKNWEMDSAATLCVSREMVEPIYENLRRRALTLPNARKSPTVERILEHGLHLITDSGRVITRARVNGAFNIFLLPEGTATVSLVSRVCRPSDGIGPFVDDRRLLGVLVGQVKLFAGRGEQALISHLTGKDDRGWYEIECEECRWTQGRAELTVGLQRGAGPGVLAIEIKAGGPYIIDTERALAQIA